MTMLGPIHGGSSVGDSSRTLATMGRTSYARRSFVGRNWPGSTASEAFAAEGIPVCVLLNSEATSRARASASPSLQVRMWLRPDDLA